MHQAGEGGQVGHIKVVGLVQHQVAGQQAQHGRNLAATAQAFGGGGEVVYGADQQGRGNEGVGFGVVGQALQQRVLAVAFVEHGACFVQQCLAGCGAGGFGLLLPVFKQRPAGRTADLDGQLLVAQLQVVLEHAPGLQRERAQPHGKGAAQAGARVGQRIHDAGIAQCFAAAGGGHVDDECATVRCAGAHAGGQVGGFVLPGKARVGASFFEGLVVFERGQAAGEAGQGARHQRGMGLYAQQVLVQRLIEKWALALIHQARAAIILIVIAARVGVQRVVFAEVRGACCRVGEAGVVVVGQHEAQARNVHGKGVVQHRALSSGLRQLQQFACVAAGLFAPGRLGDGQPVREVPVGLHSGGLGALAWLVPVRADAQQHVVHDV